MLSFKQVAIVINVFILFLVIFVSVVTLLVYNLNGTKEHLLFNVFFKNHFIQYCYVMSPTRY